MISRRMMILGLMASTASSVQANALLTSRRPPQARPPATPPPVGGLVDKAKLKGEVAFAVADAKTGDVLEAYNPDTPIAPASVAKAITALYALDVLGPLHQFSTTVMATGGVANGVVQGDLVLVGGGDPVMDTRDLAALASQVKASGIREVKGGFVVYEGPYDLIPTIDPGQPDHVGYSPAVSGIALNFNRVHFQWQRGNGTYDVTMDARAGKYRPEVDVARMKIADRRAPIYTYTATDGRDNWTVARAALGNGGSRWLPVRRPGLYAGEVFATLMRSHGVVLEAPKTSRITPRGALVAQVKSPALSEILKAMLKYSNNLVAEMVGLSATVARVGQVKGLAASAAEMNRWAQQSLGMRDPSFVDHSGLGGTSRVTPRDMITGLAAIGHAGLLRPMMKPVKLLDSQGRVINNHPVRADAKTGTLNFVSGLAGYITTPGGRDLVFAVFAADDDTRATLSREERERPPGGRSYAIRARRLQRQLVMRWGAAFDGQAG